MSLPWVGTYIRFNKYLTMARILYGFLMALAILSTPALAFAHPGHGHGDGMSLKHYLVNNVHLFPLLLAGAIIVAVIVRMILKTRGIKSK